MKMTNLDVKKAQQKNLLSNYPPKTKKGFHLQYEEKSLKKEDILRDNFQEFDWATSILGLTF